MLVGLFSLKRGKSSSLRAKVPLMLEVGQSVRTVSPVIIGVAK